MTEGSSREARLPAPPTTEDVIQLSSVPTDVALAAQMYGAQPPIESDPDHPDARVMVNPISGERVIIRLSGAQTGGQLLVFDLYLPPGAHVPARHVHPTQEEQFTIIGGQMRFRVGRFGWRGITAGPGATVRVPPGTAHWFGNTSREWSHARVEVRPALRMEELFEMTEELGAQGHRSGARRTHLSDLARVALDFQQEVAVPNVPAFLVKLLLAPLAALSRRRMLALHEARDR